jgi:malonyl CoA-acyl carrier protein transacylase
MDKRNLEPIAVIGIGAIMPKANDKDTFWQNIISGKNCISEVPKSYWDWKLYYDPDPKALDKTYTKIGGFIDTFEFDPIKHRIPPQIAKQIDDTQKLAIETAVRAIADAGYDKKPYDKTRTAVIIGNAMGGMKKEESDLRVYRFLYNDALKHTKSFEGLDEKTKQSLLADVNSHFQDKFIPITEDTMPGELSNVIAGRVANVLNVNGTNFTVDAACATSLAAIDQAVNGLRVGNYDMVVCGGVDKMMSASSYVKFCKIGALSATGSFVFDARANGFVMAEGAGMVILKRLSDAVKSGDRIYAVIRSVGASSDGKGKGITAPNPKGQKIAIARAFEQVDYSPADVGLMEAHGTATRVGDITEANLLKEMFAPYHPNKTGVIGLTSVKSQIGHTKAAAGIASFIKTSLALHNKVLPCSNNFETPNPEIDFKNNPFRVITKTEEWKSNGKPRRANVSSFGFGGTNFHVAMEEYDPNSTPRIPDARYAKASIPPTETKSDEPQTVFTVSPEKLQSESIVFSANSKPELFAELKTFIQQLKNTDPYPLILVSHKNNSTRQNGKFAVSMAAEGPTKLKEKINFFIKTAQNGDVWNKPSLHLKIKGIYPFHPTTNTSKVGFMFPGQGSQYVDMMKDLSNKYQVVKDTFSEADEILKGLINTTLTEVVFSKEGESKEELEKREDAIKQTQMTQPAVLTADIAMLRLLEQFGVKPDFVMGHSLGEYAAAVASGIFTFENGLLAVTNRAKEMSNVRVPDPGKMASVAAPAEKVEAELKKVKGYIVAANKNCPSQTVIAGEKKSIEEAIKLFSSLGIQAVEIPVSHAFHSEIISMAVEPYRNFLTKIPISKAKIPLLSNVTADVYPTKIPDIQNLLVKQLTHTVEWIKQLEKMYSLGVRLFIECGPKRVLSAFATSTLQDKDDIKVLSSNHPKRGGILEFNDLLANLMSAGVNLNWNGKNPLEDKTDYHPTFLHWAREVGGVKHTPSQSVARPVINTVGAQSNPSSHDCSDKSDCCCSKSISVSGIAAGTPGTAKKVFRDGNIDEILKGENLIEPISEEFQKKQIDKNISYVVKSQSGNHRIEKLTSIEQAVKLCAAGGDFDLEKEFGLPTSWVRSMDSTFKLAIAAGILALKDAGIPLVQQYKKTSTGKYLPEYWGLPPSMMDETGVIFASAFPCVESIVNEVAGHFADKYQNRNSEDIYKAYDKMIQKISDPKDRRELSTWFAQNFSNYESSGKVDAYTLSQDFLLKIIPIGHSQFCQWIRARGPATHVSGACASTTEAITIAEDWIKTGRAKRVVVIAGDNVTGPKMDGWVLGGLLATGAATTEAKLEKAALPFDRRRNGLVAGMGAVGLVIEEEKEVRKRGMKPLVKILGSTIANSAFHPMRLDVTHVAQVMNDLVTKVERKHDLNRHDMAKKMMFMSHETYTPARGGSASAEVNALKLTFGESATNVIVSNVKGFTGHTMGVGMEDVVAVRALNTGIIPPIANYKEPDPELAGITLSKGGHYDFQYALRLAAGFGSQMAMFLAERTFKDGENRVENETLHENWLKEISRQDNPQLEVVKNTLRVKDIHPKAGEKPPITIEAPQAFVIQKAATLTAKAETKPEPKPEAPKVETPKPATATKQSLSEDKVTAEVLDMISEKTGYPKDMLDIDLDMEADLGIDTVKQAELFASIRENYGLPRKEGLKLKDYPTIRHCVKFVLDGNGDSQVSAPAPENPAEPTPAQIAKVEPKIETAKPAQTGLSEDKVTAEVLDMISEKTGYPKDMLDIDLDMEADLGIDTVKQAELFASIRENYGLPREEGLKLKDYPTIRHCVKFVLDGSGSSSASAPSTPTPPKPAEPKVEPATVTQKPSTPKATGVSEDKVTEEILDMIAEKTGYPKDMLDIDLDMEADLGIDTVKQAELFATIRENYGLPREEGLKLKDYPTIRHCVKFVMDGKGGALESVEPSVEPTPAPSEPEVKPEEKPEPKSESSSSNLSEDKVTEEVLDMIAEKTGYPKDMLDIDLDMEADLGIDTVKQAELFATIRENYGLPREEGLKLKDYPTIRHCVKFVMDGSASSPAKPTAPKTETIDTAETAKPSAPHSDSKIRFEIDIVPAELEKEENRKLSTKRPVLIFSDNSALTRSFQSELLHMNVPNHVFTSLKSKSKNTTNVDWSNMDELQKILKKHADSNGPIQGILYLLGCSHKKFDKHSNPHDETVKMVMPLFIGCKVFEKHLANHEDDITPFISICMQLDGGLGYTYANKAFDPVYGSLSGAVQCLRKDMYELTKTNTKLIDFEPEESLETITQKTLFEILKGDERLSVCYPKSGKRHTTHAVPVYLNKDSLNYDLFGKTFIITGGGRGLGALFSKITAQRFKSRILIFDIIKVSPDTPKWAAMNDDELKKIKTQMWNELKADKTKKATPVMLEREFAKVTDSVTLYRNMEEIKKLGAEVEYFYCDVTDNKMMDSALSKIKNKYGKIDGLVHFAGLERSKLVNEKTIEEFFTVFDVKANSAMAFVASEVVKKTGFYVFISSIAGKFGNLGQSDYAAASDYIAKLALSLTRQGIRAVSVDMSGYASIGMAVRPGVEAFLKSQGLIFLDPNEGMSAICDEIVYGKVPEIVLTSSLGKLDWDKQVRTWEEPRESGSSSSNHGGGSQGSDFTFIENVKTLKKGDQIKAEKEFTVEKDPYLIDHSIGETPYVPGVMGIETFMETATLALGSTPLGLKDVHFSLPIKLLRSRPQTVRINGHKTGSGFDMEIESDFINSKGVKMGNTRKHFSADILSEFNSKWDNVEKPEISPKTPEVTKEEIYKIFFHGPSFQVLDSITKVDGKHTIATYKKPSKTPWHGKEKPVVANPLIIEAAFQACGFRDLHIDSKMTLPDYIGKVVIAEGKAPDTLHILSVFKGKTDEGKSVYDAFAFDDDGKVWVELENFYMIPQ